MDNDILIRSRVLINLTNNVKLLNVMVNLVLAHLMFRIINYISCFYRALIILK